MKSYQYILLDWDGNLVKTLQIWLESTVSVLKSHGYNQSEDEVIEILSELADMERRFGIKNIEKIIDEIDGEVKKRLPNVELYPDALYVLENLHSRGKQVALVTSANRHLVFDALEKYNLTTVFDTVITGNDVKHYKPHPEPLEIALKRLGGNKEQAIMIGDTSKDIGAANNTGIDSILFFPPEHKRF